MISKRGSGRTEEGASKEEGGRMQEGSSQVGKERRPESSKRQSEKALQISARNSCPETNQAVSKIHGTFDQKAALSKIGTRNC